MPKKKGPHKPAAKGAAPEFPPNCIKAWRVFRGMTVAELAEAAGMSDGNLSEIENRKQGYSADGLMRLAKALKVDTGTLLNVDPSQSPALWSLWLAASQSQREHITELAQTVVKTKR